MVDILSKAKELGSKVKESVKENVELYQQKQREERAFQKIIRPKIEAQRRQAYAEQSIKEAEKQGRSQAQQRFTPKKAPMGYTSGFGLGGFGGGFAGVQPRNKSSKSQVPYNPLGGGFGMASRSVPTIGGFGPFTQKVIKIKKRKKKSKSPSGFVIINGKAYKVAK